MSKKAKCVDLLPKEVFATLDPESDCEYLLGSNMDELLRCTNTEGSPDSVVYKYVLVAELHVSTNPVILSEKEYKSLK